ncbi:lytic polysaccharide monooxygenase auxiliary activity family 9 protein [Candidatus Symbiopectobacterium sp. NZEC127]|uniref:lytic polysaccharide monooxygenase auxiliary activity family 9 protein n=1 Tax=Candidatus Symbiopectobacterium sp. NZEC127 TaxID=2820472 RepID=UPI0029CAAD7D|nr:lytic polysaccharide monooxygenase auxiliary activity family 9 protein [Candidatus Symbiopectobacterium sp. NZEC127]
MRVFVMTKPANYDPQCNEPQPDPCNEYHPEPCPPKPCPPRPEHDNCCCVPEDKYYFGDLYHGQVTSPMSRSAFAASRGWIGAWEANEMEGGKNFPDFIGGPFQPLGFGDAFLTDTPSAAPPANGLIVSGGRTGNRDVVNFTDAELQAARGTTWPRTTVTSGQTFNVNWVYTAQHRTRGYRWFLTYPNWNPSQRLNRGSFNLNGIVNDFTLLAPFWNFTLAQMPPRVSHSLQLPQRTGHHVLLLIWIVADTPMGFYQAFDLNFV